jgi:hypothetical protein
MSGIFASRRQAARNALAIAVQNTHIKTSFQDLLLLDN